LHEQLLGLLNSQLEARGYIVKQTTLVDATIVASSRHRPKTDDAASGQAPDAEASYTRKGRRTYYGYKAHVSSDAQHHWIRTAVISTAKAQDGHVFERVAPTETREIYADKAYDTKKIKAWVRSRHLRRGILKRPAHHIKLSPSDKRENRRKSRVRCHIERIFAHLKSGRDTGGCVIWGWPRINWN
jgi:IS5 family transposase